jgi:hypothetical protein
MPDHVNALNVLDRAFGNAPAKKITGDEMKGWLATTDWSVKTRNNMMGYWKNAFSIGNGKNIMVQYGQERVAYDDHGNKVDSK